jgi:hypothetical protein
MIIKNFTQDDFLITNGVFEQIKNSPEMYEFHLSLFSSLEINPLLKWTHETLKKHESLFLTLAVQERTEEYTVNAYYHLLQLATQYEDIDINWNSALELAQETIKELFEKYDDKRIEK